MTAARARLLPSSRSLPALDGEADDGGFVVGLLAGFLKSYIERLDGLGGYTPQDPKIGIAAFTALGSTLDEFNQSIPIASQALTDAISDRQDSFNGPTALKFVFDGVKGSVKGQYGQASLQYKSISGIIW